METQTRTAADPDTSQEHLGLGQTALTEAVAATLEEAGLVSLISKAVAEAIAVNNEELFRQLSELVPGLRTYRPDLAEDS